MGCAGRQRSWLIWIAFSSGDQVPSDLPLETVPRPPHLEGEEVRAWEFHQMVVVEDQSASSKRSLPELFLRRDDACIVAASLIASLVWTEIEKN